MKKLLLLLLLFPAVLAAQDWQTPVETANFEATPSYEETIAFLRQIEGQWRLTGARRGPLTIDYSNFAGGRPSTVHLQTTSARGVAPADLALRISQVEINTPLDNAVFYADVPPNAVPLTLEELRRAGPLGGE